MLQQGAMRLNADFSQRVVIRPGDVPWVPSPVPGVERRMLDRIGDEVARATSFVRYAARSRYAPHEHGGGEEFLVLEGEFADGSGRYPRGCYVRNPVGSRHAPFTDTGCTIFVKLWQFDARDRAHVVIDTASAQWTAGQGISTLPLHAFGRERVRLERWPAGTRGSQLDCRGGCEIVVLEGCLDDEEGTYPAGTWMRMPHAARHAPASDAGCMLYVKTGHLPAA
jgi:anti-sigma factor ChrR (cupin superfamily)